MSETRFLEKHKARAVLCLMLRDLKNYGKIAEFLLDSISALHQIYAIVSLAELRLSLQLFTTINCLNVHCA